MPRNSEKRLRRQLFIGVLLLALIAGAGTLWLHRIEERRLAAVAKIHPPPAYAFYRAITESGAAPSAEVLASVAHLNINADPFDSLFAFEQILQQRIKTIAQGPEWNSVRDLTDSQDFSFEGWTDENDQALGLYVANQSNFILKLRDTAARGGPIHRLNIGDAQQMQLPHLAPVRDLTSILRADALFHVRQGAYDEVEADLRAMAQLGQALSSEPVLISQMVRVAVMGIFFQTVEDVMDAGDLPPATLTALINESAGLYQRDAFAESLQGEAMMVLASYKAIRAGELSRDFFTGQSIAAGGITRGRRRARSNFIEEFAAFIEVLFHSLATKMDGSILTVPSLKIDETRYAETMSALIEVSPLPYYEASPRIKEIEEVVEETFPEGLLYEMMLPALLRVGKAQARLEVYIDLIRIACALELYRNEYSTYPETLDLIAQRLGGALPIDPYIGTPYHYSLTGDAFLLYSVGGNLIDDKGVNDIRKGDIVWRGE